MIEYPQRSGLKQKKCTDPLFGNLEFQNQDVSRAMFPLAFLRCDEHTTFYKFKVYKW